jgi:hypothetical protein
MRRLALSLIVLFLGAGCDKLRKSDDGSSGATPKEGPAAVAGCVVPQDANVTSSWTVPPGCKLTLPEGLTISENATVTIGAGARLAFGAQKMLNVNKGKLVARGTDKEPIVFTSAAKTPAAGDWIGIAFGDVMAGNVLDRVTVEYAGNSNRFGTGVEAAIGIADTNGGRIAITGSTFRKNKGVAIDCAHDPVTFAKLEGNTFSDGTYSMHVSPNLLGGMGVNKIEKPIRVEGSVIQTQTWPKLDVPVVVAKLEIGGDKGSAVLTLTPGATLKMETGVGIGVGLHDGAGGLVARNVTFTSAAAAPAVGDWTGIVFSHKTTGSVLEGSTIEYAGKAWSSGEKAVIEVTAPTAIGTQLVIKNTTFRKSGDSVIHGADCANAAKPELANKSEGAALCAPH